MNYLSGFGITPRENQKGQYFKLILQAKLEINTTCDILQDSSIYGDPP